ncbi:condensin complex subunit 2/barren [Schizophyllum amplum]|uniref:Condensin complex subunit 2 n=1 Tax=Schizophyllum amplum TaxID=97359 RepID=A0A550CKF5_9AGAR|nr:condensin complex subunit 2/barren [Auriculariopsis ampla]
MARRQSPDESSLPLYDDDSESGSERQATPKPRKSNAKRRMSEYHPPDGDSSLNDSRAALKESSMQDDAAERRRRRKSTKINVLPADDEEDEGRQQAESSRAPRQQRPLRSVPAPTTLNVPLDVMNSNFEQWMKMATDNKINAGNSWNLSLIDYFHNQQLLRNKDDNSINFQRASCTLDGCVKIWTSRVDSVGTETSKLATHLAAGGNEDADEGGESDNPDADPSQPKKKKTKRAESTLGNPSKLRVEKLDLEFSVDPLFKKTCADFDEGGAQGLLMNHLSLGVGKDSALRIIFDASDSVCRVVEEDEIEGDEPEDLIDLTEIKSKFLPDLSLLEDKAISHSLNDFSFSKSQDAMLNQPLSVYMDDDDDDTGAGFNDTGMDIDGAEPQAEEDFFAHDDGEVFDDGPINGADYGDDQGNADYGGGDDYGGGGTPGVGGGAGHEPFDPTRTDGELFMAMTHDNEKNMFEEFDKRGNANWMGPGGPLKRPSRLARLHMRDNESTENKPKKPREKKEPFKVPFGDRPESMKEINAKLFATSKTSINLTGFGPNARGKKKRDEHLLPDDMHFSSRQLITLFLKSRFAIKIRGRKPVINERGDGEVADDYWQQQAAGDGGGDDDYDGGDPPPFSTQFMEDDIDESEQDLAASTLGTARRLRPQSINYARRAKRVDVRKLKDNIWQGLEMTIKEPESMDVDDDDASPQFSDGRAFGEVIQGLQTVYKEDKLEDISTSFCFICLLHLANEQGLKLEAPAGLGVVDEDEDEDGHEEAKPQEKVGNLWDVKVYRDPTATKAS